jgi:hypothetical protein
MLNMISNFLAAVPENDATNSPAPAAKKPLSAASAEFVPDPVEYEPQSANLDAEVEGEMKECLDAILKNHQNSMNFAVATKAKLTPISMGTQREGLRERSRNNSEDATSSDSEHSDSESAVASSPRSRPNEEGVVLADDESCWADEEYLSVKSFGTKRVTGFYRTKEQRDETRRKHLADVAQRAGRHPNQRNVAAKAHYASDRGNRQRRYEVRGGRQSSQASALVQ